MNAATEAELSHRGSGLSRLMGELLARNVIDPSPALHDEGPRGAIKVWRGRGRTGSLEAHFFTQNSGIVFFEGRAEKDAFDRRVKNVSQINGDVFE